MHVLGNSLVFTINIQQKPPNYADDTVRAVLRYSPIYSDARGNFARAAFGIHAVLSYSIP